jgi:hypothetical protein
LQCGVARFRVAEHEELAAGEVLPPDRAGKKQLEIEEADWNRRASAVARLLGQGAGETNGQETRD